MEDELKNSISKRYESTSLCGILDLFNITYLRSLMIDAPQNSEVYNALIKKYGNPYSKEKENNKALWIMDYKEAVKLHEENTKACEQM